MNNVEKENMDNWLYARDLWFKDRNLYYRFLASLSEREARELVTSLFGYNEVEEQMATRNNYLTK